MAVNKIPSSISPTKLRAYSWCPLAYRYRFIEHLRFPPTPESLLGSALHVMMEANFRSKRKSHSDLSLEELEEVFDVAWDRDLPVEVDNPRFSRERFDLARELGYVMTAFFWQAVAPNVKPHLVEHRFKFMMDGVPVPIIGQVDLVNTGGTVIDHKTSGSPYDENYLQHDLQLFCYSLGYTLIREGMRLREGQMPSARRLSPVRVDIILRRPEPELQQLSRSYTEADIERIGADIRFLASGIISNKFEPFWIGDEKDGAWQKCAACEFETVCERSLTSSG